MTTTYPAAPCPACLHHYEARPRAHYIAEGCAGCGAKATHHVWVVGPSCPGGEPMGDDYDVCEACAKAWMRHPDPFKHMCDACEVCHQEGGRCMHDDGINADGEVSHV